MSQPIDLLDDFSAIVVSSAPPVSPWALPAPTPTPTVPQQQQHQQQQPSQGPMHPASYQSNANYASSKPVVVNPPQQPIINANQQQVQRSPIMPPKAHSTYEITPSHAYPSTLVTTNNTRDTSYEVDSSVPSNTNSNIGSNNNQMVNYTNNDNALAESTDFIKGPLCTDNPEKKLAQMTSILAKHVPPNASPLPFLPIHASGYILCRISFRTLLFKKWKQCYWMLYGTSKLLIFRSKSDADDWRYNPYHTKNERDFLVRLCIDFLNDCKIIQNCRGYKISPLGHKSYGLGRKKEQDLMYHFKLERCMDYGPVIAACFASQDKTEVESIRKVIIQCIKYALKELKQLHNNNTASSSYMPQPPPVASSSSYGEDQPQKKEEKSFAYNDNYVFDYESGKPIPVSEFQNRRHSAQPRIMKSGDDAMVARGRYTTENE